MAFLGPKICDTCMQPFKPGDLIYQADGEPDWCFHASDCPGPPSEEDMERIMTELSLYQLTEATTALSTDRQSGCSNESTKDGSRE
mgnify:FL=1